MKTTIKIFSVIFLLFGIFKITYASTTVHLDIHTQSDSLFNQEIAVEPCESDNPPSGNLKITAYCTVLQSGLDSDWNFTWAPGIFLNSINGIAGFTTEDSEGNPIYHYWSWYLNGTEGTVGLNQYELQENDQISLVFIDPKPETEPVVSSYSSSNTTQEEKIFDLEKAFAFLISQQKEDGSFGESLYTDWVAMALASEKGYENEKIKLKNFLENKKTENYSLTDCERHSMALMSLGIDPYGPAGIYCMEKIIGSFDKTQFGDKEKINDDIFALIVLQNAGFDKEDEMISKTINFIVSKQEENGSWENSVDMTGAVMQTLSFFAGENFLLRGVSQADEPRASVWRARGDSDLEKEEFSLAKILNTFTEAKEFLKQNQKDDGGFGNVSSTAWAIGGMLALGEKPVNSVENVTPETFDIQKVFRDEWVKNDKNPLDYLAEMQDSDGGIKNDYKENKIWETAYVATSLSGKTWNEIMQKFNAQSLASDGVKTIITETIAKPESKKQNKKITKVENLSKELTANSIQTISENPTPETPKKQNWFWRLLGKIFSF